MPTTCFVDLTLGDDEQCNQGLQSNQVSYKKCDSKASTKGYLLSKQGLAKSKTFEEKELEQPECKQNRSHLDANYITQEMEVDAVPIGANYQAIVPHLRPLPCKHESEAILLFDCQMLS